MIVSELILGEVELGVLPVHAAAGTVQALGIAPEPLQAVDVRRAVGLCLGAVDGDVFAELLQVVVAGELVDVED